MDADLLKTMAELSGGKFYTEIDVERLMKNEGIVRNRQKIEATIRNARAYLQLREAGIAFGAFLWDFVGGEPKQNRWRSLRQLPARIQHRCNENIR